jgi:hypothetical protein
VVPPSRRSPEQEIPAAIEEVVMRALAKEPSARFPTAASFAEALRITWHPRVKVPRLAVGTNVTAFSTEATTRDWQREDRGKPLPIPMLRLVVAQAIAGGEGDAIITAYLDLIRGLVDDRQLATAVDELEHGLALLRPNVLSNAPPAATWRLQLCLSALYSGIGDRIRARHAADLGRDDAIRAESTLGQVRAGELIERLSRNRNLPRTL